MKRSAFFLIVILALLAATALVAEKPVSTLKFIVVAEKGGKPVRNAEVVLHAVDNKGKQHTQGLEVKTHQDGKAEVPGVPYGRVRVQVIADGYRTFGEDFDISQPVHEITVKMQKPTDQYSIYEKHDDKGDKDKNEKK
jgi:5-hydroxyisourate hydrolase-like protein (transthyretin family)